MASVIQSHRIVSVLAGAKASPFPDEQWEDIDDNFKAKDVIDQISAVWKGCSSFGWVGG